MNHSDHEAHTTNANDNNPVATLPHDLLHDIFSINVEVFKHPSSDRIALLSPNDPLLDLRNLSQVCSTWRCIILASPALWARSISLDHLLHWKHPNLGLTDEELEELDELDDWEEIEETWTEQDPARYLWMNEVLRRTKNAPLWVQGTDIHRKSSVNATLGLLKRDWDRIERLAIENISSHDFDSEFEDILTRPAPILQEFQLNIYHPERPPCFMPIFLHYAPSLLNLHASNFSIDSCANRLPNLRVLRITTHSESNVPQLLDVLPQLPLLNTLCIDGLIEAKEPTRLDEFERNIFQPIGAFAKRFVQSKQPNCIGLVISESSFTIGLTTPGKRTPDFFFEFSNTYDLEFSDIDDEVEPTIAVFMESLINVFSFREMCCVTAFELYQRVLVKTELFESLPLFSNVGVLITDERSLLLFFDPSARPQGSSSCVVFPLVHTVRLHTLSISHFSGPKKLKNVLKRLRDERRPFNVLDITKCSPGYYPSLHTLESLTGMKILWMDPGFSGIQEYICGSKQHQKPVFMTPPRSQDISKSLGYSINFISPHST